MKKFISHGLPFIFLCCFVVILLNAALARPRIIVVMSYDLDNKWEQEIRKGIDKTFAKKAPHYQINYFYLNTMYKSASMIQRSVSNVLAIINTWRPQVLIIVDDDAQKYIGKSFVNNSTLSIVFNGVNANPAIYGYKPHENVTGIIENLHYNSTRQALLQMFPNYHQIIHLSDNSQTSQYVYNQVLDFNWQPLQIVYSVKTNSLTEWLATIQNANQHHDLLLLTHFDAVYDRGVLIPPQKLMQITLQKARVPIFDFFDFTVADGVPMAMSTSAVEQGTAAAELTMQIIDKNKKAGDIPFASSQFFNFAINRRSVEINMPHVKIPEVYKSLAYLSDSSRL